MNITIELTGTTPLLAHNPRMVDPEFELNVKIKELTSKRKKTTEDLRTIERLEWYGGLYEENGIIVQPTAKVRKALINAGKVTKMGKLVERALSFTDVNVLLQYHGPKEIDKVFADPQFTSRLSVGVGNKRVMRVRPKFFPWALRVPGLFVEDAGLNFGEFERIAELAGIIEGMGDNRVNGYGRFEAKVVQR